MSGVRIVLKNRVTNQYLGRGGNWTEKPEAAIAFLDQTRANDHRVYHRLTDTEVVELAVLRPVNTRPPTPSPEEPASKRPTLKAAATKPRRPKAGKEKPAAPQGCEAPGNKPASTSPPTHGQLSTTGPAPETVTIIEAKLDVGFGNSVFIRGEGGGLSWDKGTPLQCRDASSWLWSSGESNDQIVFKLLLNDKLWAKGEDLIAEAGKRIEVVPNF